MVSGRDDRVWVLVLALAALLLTGCTATPNADAPYCSPSDQTTDPSTVAWLQENAIPLADNSANGFLDLEPLKKIIGGARIVAVGEATHGTREFSEAKSRLFQFLVNQMGFTTLAMEVNAPEADRLNAYLETGAGDPHQLLGELHVWPWDTQEVADLIGWMRVQNQNSTGTTRLSLSGFDMQLPHAALDELVNYVRRVDPSNHQIEEGLACYQDYQDATFGYATADPTLQKKCREGLERVFSELNRRRVPYEQASSRAEYERALRNARLVLQAEERYRAMENRDRRDAFMAENVEWILDQAGPQAKVMVWAHNTHVDEALPMTLSMGSYLHKHFGIDFFSIGFDFYKGSFNAMSYNGNKNRFGNVVAQQAALPPANSYEVYFHAVGLPRFMLDLRALASGDENPDAAWLAGPHPFRSIGTTYDASRPLDYCYDARLSDEYDLLLYFDQSSPSQLLTQ